MARFQPTKTYGLDRRKFLNMMAALTAIPNVAHLAASQVFGRPKFPDNPFKLGVASGDPEPDGVVIWTRLSPDPLGGPTMNAEPYKVEWEVARDEAFKDVVQRGSAVAMPQLGHSVHVEVEGL